MTDLAALLDEHTFRLEEARDEQDHAYRRGWNDGVRHACGVIRAERASEDAIARRVVDIINSPPEPIEKLRLALRRSTQGGGTVDARRIDPCVPNNSSSECSAEAGTSLDRINNDGDYDPDNCRWATSKEQGRNKRSSKLSTKTAKEIRDLYARGYCKSAIAKLYCVSFSTVSDVIAGRTRTP